MNNNAGAFSLPKWRITQWLLQASHDAPKELRASLVATLFGTLPIFAGGIVNTVAVSVVIAWREPNAWFIVWVAVEVLLGLTRFWLLVSAHRAARAGRETPTDIYILLALVWAASVGYGAFISMESADWVAATLACLSAAAMVGGICFRNFGAPRLVAVMIFLALGPCCAAGAMSRQPALFLIMLQIPTYLIAMSSAAFRLNKLLVTTMIAERENDRRARHDLLTGLPNRAGLVSAIEAMPHHGRAALLYLDLDGFKSVNDRYGHAAGDALLVAVSARLKRTVGEHGLVCRIGGDEFVLLLDPLKTTDIESLAEAVVRVVSEPYPLDDAVEVKVSTSVGVSFVPEHGRDVDTVLKAADTALYTAKRSGKNRWEMAPSAPSASSATTTAAAAL